MLDVSIGVKPADCVSSALAAIRAAASSSDAPVPAETKEAEAEPVADA
jgi:hypothetical protein